LVFDETGLTATFASGLPSDEMVVTRLDLSPDQSPVADSISRSYWVLHHFATDPLFDTLQAIQFEKIGLAPDLSTAQQYQLWSRPPRSEGNSWYANDTGDQLTTGADGTVVFEQGNGVAGPAQFLIARPGVSTASEHGTKHSAVRLSPNPVASNGILNITTQQLSGKVKFKLYDSQGRAVRVAVFERNGQLALNGLAAGVYGCSVENERFLWFGKVAVQ
jgi:hypothetical protein